MKPDPRNNQQVFDYIVRKLATQRTAATGSDGSCQYRGVNGCKCAVGWLFSDDDFNEDWDANGTAIFTTSGNYDSHHIEPRGPAPMLKDRGYDLELLGRLQVAHDSAGGVPSGEKTFKKWRASFRDQAKVLGLNYRLALELFKDSHQ